MIAGDPKPSTSPRSRIRRIGDEPAQKRMPVAIAGSMVLRGGGAFDRQRASTTISGGRQMALIAKATETDHSEMTSPPSAGPTRTGQIEGNCIERDRLGQIAQAHLFAHRCLPGRGIERDADAQQHGEHQKRPGRDQTEPGKQRKQAETTSIPICEASITIRAVVVIGDGAGKTPNSMIGIVAEDWISPSIWCDGVRLVISQAAPMPCIDAPRLAERLANQIERKPG